MGGQVQGRAIRAALPGAGRGRWTQAPRGWGTGENACLSVTPGSRSLARVGVGGLKVFNLLHKGVRCPFSWDSAAGVGSHSCFRPHGHSPAAPTQWTGGHHSLRLRCGAEALDTAFASSSTESPAAPLPGQDQEEGTLQPQGCNSTQIKITPPSVQISENSFP